MTFYADDKVMTPGETTLEIEESEEVIAPKITPNRAVIFARAGLELSFEEPEEALKRNDLTEKEKS